MGHITENMNKKILVFIVKKNNLLLLRNNFEDPKHGGDFWFTVTGSIEKGENEEQAIKREVKEETNLEINEIFDLNWASIYEWNKEEHFEKNFIVFVKNGEVKLSEEHVEYKWLDFKDFIEKIKWGLDKEELRKVLELGMNRKLFFKEQRVDDFRKL